MRRNFRLFALQVSFVWGVTLLTIALCEEECLGGKPYWCYECDSWSDPRCRDPFNWSAPSNDQPTLRQCEGCCVKIVTNAHQPNEVVRRTCTKNIMINLFMVDHVCMYEGRRTGHMCFCESDHCNAATSHLSYPTTRRNAILITFICAFIARHLAGGDSQL